MLDVIKFSIVQGLTVEFALDLGGDLGFGLFSNAETVGTLATLSDGLKCLLYKGICMKLWGSRGRMLWFLSSCPPKAS